MVPPICKQIAAIKSPGCAVTSNNVFSTKKQKYYNASLFLDSKEWFFLNKLWEVINDYISESYLKLQNIIEKFIFTAHVFFNCLCLIICDLYLD